MASPGPATFLPERRSLRLTVLAVLFVAALAVRLYNIGAPPTEFHPLRQFRAALIARSFYYEANPGMVDAVRLDIARRNAAQQESLEPPIIERLGALSYQIAGSEMLWLPRSLSAIFWVVGGVFLYLLAGKLLSPDGALIATAYYLLNPFGVVGSKVIQPDPLMIMLMLMSFWLIAWYYEQPSWGRLMIVGMASALSPFVKPISLFMIFMAFVSLGFAQRRHWKAVVNLQTLTFTLLMFLPTAIYYLSGILGQGGGLRDEAQAQFLPALLVQRTFWVGWFTGIGKVVGPLTFVAALVGLTLAMKDRPAIFLLGLWIGYLVMGLIFTYTISTHDYYTMQIIPLVGLCLAPLLEPLLERLRGLYARESIRAALASVLLVILALFSAYENFWRAFSHTYYENSDPAMAKLAPEIVGKVGRTASVISVSQAYSLPLEYYGQLNVADWPTRIEFAYRAVQGRPIASAQAYFDELARQRPPDYFVVTDIGEFNSQPELRSMIFGKFEIVAQGDGYVIFDLRKPVQSP